MGVLSFFKKVFTGDIEDDAELQMARARHGIKLDDVIEEDDEKQKVKKESSTEEYDAWEEIRNMRANFWFGTWTRRKLGIIGEDKLKKDLEKLEKKREEQRRQKGEE